MLLLQKWLSNNSFLSSKFAFVLDDLNAIA